MHKICVNGLLQLGDKKLEWLASNGGRIGIIEIQNGCPYQCFVCGSDAPEYNKSMAWKDFMHIVNKIVDVKEKKNIDLIVKSDKHSHNLRPADASDPILYHSKDGNIERSIYDAIMVCIRDLGKAPAITTSGWIPENTHLQRAVEKIVEDSLIEDYDIAFMYSVKTVAARTINEYKRFMKERYPHIQATGNLDPAVQLSDRDKEFMLQSKYLKRLTANLSTLKGQSNVVYCLQFIDFKQQDMKSFPEEHLLCKSIFTQEMVRAIFDKAIAQAGISRYDLSNFYIRPFTDCGTKASIGLPSTLKLDSTAIDVTGTIRLLKTDPEAYTLLDTQSHVKITPDGDLQIRIGHLRSLSSRELSTDMIDDLAYTHKDHKNASEYYTMLSEISRTNLLPHNN